MPREASKAGCDGGSGNPDDSTSLEGAVMSCERWQPGQSSCVAGQSVETCLNSCTAGLSDSAGVLRIQALHCHHLSRPVGSLHHASCILAATIDLTQVA